MNQVSKRPSPNPSGRPVGSLGAKTKMLREAAAKALAEGITPIEVMLENMRFFHEKADVLQTAVITKIGKKKLDSKEAMELLMEFKELGTSRLKAQSCAVDAAPYVHPRLSATTVSGEITHKHEEAAAAFKTIEGILEATVTGETVSEPKKKSKVAA
jgi:hypothetical protein